MKWYIIRHTRDVDFMYVAARSRYGLNDTLDQHYPMVAWSYLIVEEATIEEVMMHKLSH
jgi:hypothetical protein